MALRLLEAMRDMDLPLEILESEDPTQTIPRRFGLSDVVDRQIRTHREDVRKGVRLTDQDIHGLFRFVIRRPDGAQVFHRVGAMLGTGAKAPAWTRILPTGFRFRRARRLARRTLKKLFGRNVGGFGRQPFMIEGRSLIFIESDPGGDACHLLSGFSEEILKRTVGGEPRVAHTLCQGRGDDLCRWEGEIVVEPPSVDLQETPEESES